MGKKLKITRKKGVDFPQNVHIKSRMNTYFFGRNLVDDIVDQLRNIISSLLIGHIENISLASLKKLGLLLSSTESVVITNY